MNKKSGNIALSNEERIFNLLDKDGKANYYGKIMPSTEANRYFDLLLKNILWENEESYNIW